MEKYWYLVEKLIQLEPNYWPGFQEQLKNLQKKKRQKQNKTKQNKIKTQTKNKKKKQEKTYKSSIRPQETVHNWLKNLSPKKPEPIKLEAPIDQSKE